jgi:hypothetical protein
MNSVRNYYSITGRNLKSFNILYQKNKYFVGFDRIHHAHFVKAYVDDTTKLSIKNDEILVIPKTLVIPDYYSTKVVAIPADEVLQVKNLVIAKKLQHETNESFEFSIEIF